MDIRESCDRWIEVDLDAVTENYRQLRTLLAPKTRLMAVLKADAYGLGAAPLAKTLAEAGADWLAVSTAEEGVELRRAGVETPILVFSPLLERQQPLFQRYRLTASVDSAVSLQRAASADIPCQLKLDTGMSRLGCAAEDALSVWQSADLKNFALTGVYSHLANAAAPESGACRRQLQRFAAAVSALDAAGVPRGLAHISNSAAILSIPDAQYDMVRSGTLLYGQYPAGTAHKLSLQNPWRVAARVLSVRRLPKGSAVGYGGEYVLPKDEWVAAVALGYADGFAVETAARRATLMRTLNETARRLGRLAAGRTLCLYWNGKALPVLGRVGMQLCCVRAEEGLLPGTVLEAPMRRVTASARMTRVYLRQGQPVAFRGLLSEEAGLLSAS